MRWFSAPVLVSLVLAACSKGGSDADDTDVTGETDVSSDTDDTTSDDTTSDDTEDDTDDTDDTDDSGIPGVPVTLANGGFEAQNLSAGGDRFQGYTGGVGLLIPSWTYYIANELSGVGVTRPVAASFSAVEPMAAPAEGNHVAYLDGRNGSDENVTAASLSHEVTQSVAVGEVIHARIAFGARLEDSVVAVHRTLKLQILLDSSVLAEEIVLLPSVGGWRDAQVSYEATSALEHFTVSVLAEQVDMSGVSYWQTYVDNLRVSIE